MDVIRTAFEAWKFKRSRASLIRLLEASQQLIFGVCYEVLRHREDSEDVTQRVLLEIQKGLDQVQDGEHFLKRLRLVAFRTALDTRRDRRRRIDRERKAADMNPSPSITEGERESIHEAMAALDEESRSLVMEHYFEKVTLDEMGRRRGVSGAAVWKRIEDVKGRLRNGLALAGLAAAASKAEACLESVTLVTPPANLVTATVLGGGFMAAKMSTATAATVVAVLTFALGLGGGLAIQSARLNKPTPGFSTEAVASGGAVARTSGAPANEPEAPEPPREEAAPIVADATEDRFKLPREIWVQFSRARFWKDKEAQDETMPKVELLGPEHAPFFIEKFRDPGSNHEARKNAVRLAMTCGGPEAAALLLEITQAGPAKEANDFRMNAYIVLKGESWGGMPELPFSEALKNAALPLLTVETGWDRSMALSVLAYGDPAHWKPIVKEAAKGDISGLMRSEAVELLVKRGDADILAFLRDQGEAIRTLAPDPRYGPGAAQEVEFQKERLGRVVDQAIAEIERRLKK